VSLRTEFQSLYAQLESLDETLSNLRTAIDDHPTERHVRAVARRLR
jgi:hypothetical protein